MSEVNPLFPSAAKTIECEQCGYTLPLELGQETKTCKEWAAATIRSLPPKSLSISFVVEMANFTRHCDVLTMLKRGPQAGKFGAQSVVTVGGEKKNG